jgi:predicted GIY-YIG superfamily endonuclease
MYYVYILRSLKYPDRLYTGLTTDVDRRLEYHNTGKSMHTSRYKPWKLILQVGFDDKGRAARFEKYLKTASGAAFRNKRLI